MDCINRDLIVKETLAFLVKNQKTSQMEVQEYIQRTMLDRPEIKELAAAEEPLPPEVYLPEDEKLYLTSKTVRGLIDDLLLAANEVVWDLIIERVLTPGRNAYHKGGLTLSVTDPDRLKAKLQELNTVH